MVNAEQFSAESGGESAEKCVQFAEKRNEGFSVRKGFDPVTGGLCLILFQCRRQTAEFFRTCRILQLIQIRFAVDNLYGAEAAGAVPAERRFVGCQHGIRQLQDMIQNQPVLQTARFEFGMRRSCPQKPGFGSGIPDCQNIPDQFFRVAVIRT